jgi:uncharacterized protein
MAWVISSAAATALIVLVIGSLMWLLGRRFIKEFTRPGVVVEQDTPQWGGWTFPDAVAEPPKHLQHAVTFQSGDGVRLCGEFWAQSCSAPTVVISHGFHLPSVYFRSVAALEYAHGVNVLLFDYRGHGESSLIPTTCGNAEVSDLGAAVDIAMNQKETIHGQVYIHGFSMGAAVALLLPPHPAVAGIIADSSYARLDDMIRLLGMQVLRQETAGLRGPTRIVRPLIPLLTSLMLLGGRLMFLARYHRPLVARPDQAIGNHAAKLALHASGTIPPPILLIHAENDPFIALHHAHRLVTAAQAVGRVIQVYYTPCDIHCGSYGHDPSQYMTLLENFVALNSAL